MRAALQKLFRHGNTTGVVIPRPMLIAQGWLPGERVVVEELADGGFKVRRPVETDMDAITGRVQFSVQPPAPTR